MKVVRLQTSWRPDTLLVKFAESAMTSHSFEPAFTHNGRPLEVCSSFSTVVLLPFSPFLSPSHLLSALSACPSLTLSQLLSLVVFVFIFVGECAHAH